MTTSSLTPADRTLALSHLEEIFRHSEARPVDGDVGLAMMELALSLTEDRERTEEPPEVRLALGQDLWAMMQATGLEDHPGARHSLIDRVGPDVTCQVMPRLQAALLPEAECRAWCREHRDALPYTVLKHLGTVTPEDLRQALLSEAEAASWKDADVLRAVWTPVDEDVLALLRGEEPEQPPF